MKRASQRLAQRLSQRLSARDKSETETDGTSEIIDFRGVSMQVLVDTLKAVEDGTAAPGVRIFVAVVDISTKVLKGAIILLTGVKRNGKMTGTVAYVAGSVAFGPEQAREKPRGEWTTEDVAEHVVLAATMRTKCIYLDVIPDEEDVGKEYQGAFVSQARSCSFASLVEALATHYAAQGVDLREQFVWLDLFSANQPLLTSADSALPASVQQERYNLLTNGLHVAIDKFDERVIFFDTWDNPTPLTRSWCVWEIYGSIRHGKFVQPVFAPGQEEAFLEVLLRDVKEITQTFADIDTRKAECFKAEDKAMIDGAIETQLKDGFTTLNADILASLRTWLTASAHSAVAKAKAQAQAQGGRAADDNEAQLEYARVLFQAGWFLHDQAKHDEALEYYDEALSIRKAELGEHHLLVASSLNNIAGVYNELGRFPEALVHYEEALRIRKEKLGEQHPDVATTLNRMALVYSNQAKHAVALSYYEEALDMRKAALGEQHPDVARSLNDMARLLAKLGRYEEALACYDGALGIDKATLGERHPTVATTLKDIARVYFRQGKYEEALVPLEEALSIFQEALGDEHPHVGATLSLIGGVYHKQGRDDEALPLLKRALRIRQDHASPGVAYSLAFIAEVYSSTQQLEEALDFFARALETAVETLPVRNRATPRIMHGTAVVHQAQGDRAKALRLFRQALDLRKDLLGDAHPDTIETQAAVNALT